MADYMIDVSVYEEHLALADTEDMELGLDAITLSSSFDTAITAVRNGLMQHALRGVWDGEIGRFAHATPDRSSHAVFVAKQVLAIARDAEQMMAEEAERAAENEGVRDWDAEERAHDKYAEADEAAQGANDFDEGMFELDDDEKKGT